jgi:hypothetical protein
MQIIKCWQEEEEEDEGLCQVSWANKEAGAADEVISV